MPEVSTLLAELAEIRSACEAEDWDRVGELAELHVGQVRQALAEGRGLALAPVLEAQRHLMEDVAVRRDAAAERLRGLKQAGRAAQAYRQGEG